MINIHRKELHEIIELALSWIVVLAMFAYGFGKFVQFEGVSYDNLLVSELTGMELLWAFYGYSKTFVLILGTFEIIGAILIFFKKTRIIGCIFTTGILLNIILQDIFYNVNIGALKAALIYQFCILIILYFNRNILISSIRLLLKSAWKIGAMKGQVYKYLVAFFLFVIIRIIEFYITTNL